MSVFKRFFFSKSSWARGLLGTHCVVLEPAGASDGALCGHGVPAGWDGDVESVVHVLQLVFSINFSGSGRRYLSLLVASFGPSSWYLLSVALYSC